MKILFLTGCNGQLGFTFSNSFKKNNWTVVGLDLEITSPNPHLDAYISGNVCSRDSFKELFRFVTSDILSIATNICLINNAGVAVFTPSEERNQEEFNLVTKVNLLGPIYGITEFREYFVNLCENMNIGMEALNFSVINISSIYGLLSPNNSIYSDTARNSSEIYGATKAGVNQLTRYFAVRYAKDSIQVNAIAPGGVLNYELQGPEFIENYSNLVPMKRLCHSTEVSDMALNLATASVKYLTGQVIALDGGMSSW